MNSFRFTTPLVEGIIEKRKSQFTMTVNYEGQSVACHCPTTGRIGNLDVAGRPCLLSGALGPDLRRLPRPSLRRLHAAENQQAARRRSRAFRADQLPGVRLRFFCGRITTALVSAALLQCLSVCSDDTPKLSPLQQIPCETAHTDPDAMQGRCI